MEEAIERAIAQRAAQIGIDRTDILPEDLIGECPYNAAALVRELDPVWDVGPVFAKRGAVFSEGEYRPENLSEAVDKGLIHWWVEAIDEQTERCWTCDIASALPIQPGLPVIRTNRPADYSEFGERLTIADIDSDPFFGRPA